MKKTLWAGASGGLVAGMIWVGGANTALAEATDAPIAAYSQSGTEKGMHMMHKWNSPRKAGALASDLGLDKAKIRRDMRNGKTAKQILQEHGFDPKEVQRALEKRKARRME